MEIKSLQYYLQLCKDKRFSTASKNLYITPQGLNKSIRYLENELGVTLYYYDNHTIVLTQAGEELRRQAKILVSQYEEIEKQMSLYSASNYNNVVKIGCAYGVFGELYNDILSKLNDHFPEIRFVYSEYPDRKCMDAILNEEVDLGFTVCTEISKNNKNLIVQRLGSRNMGVLVNKKNPLSKNKELVCSDLTEELLITSSEDYSSYQNFMKRCKSVGFEPSIIYKGSEIRSIYSLCVADKGVAVVVDFGTESKDCEMIPFEVGNLEWTYGLHVLKEKASKNPISHIIKKIDEIARTSL